MDHWRLWEKVVRAAIPRYLTVCKVKAHFATVTSWLSGVSALPGSGARMCSQWLAMTWTCQNSLPQFLVHLFKWHLLWQTKFKCMSIDCQKCNSFHLRVLSFKAFPLKPGSKLLLFWKSASAPFPSQNLLSKWRSYVEFPFQLVIFHQHGFSPSHMWMCPI